MKSWYLRNRSQALKVQKDFRKRHGRWEARNPEAAKRANHRRAVLRRAENREWLNSLKSQPCVDCGGSFPPECMDWDHVRGRKLFCLGITSTGSRSRTQIEREMKKCELVCSNCHRIRTTRRARGKLKGRR
jgi:hypothetical protein